MPRSSPSQNWLRSIPGLAVILFASSCRRSDTAPTIVPERRSLDAAIAQDASSAIDARSSHDAHSPLDASPFDGDGPVSVTPFALRESAFVVSALYDRPLRAPVTPVIPASRSGRAPTLGAAVAALRAERASEARFVPEGAFSAIGDGRFALVTRRVDRGLRFTPSFELHVFSESDGRAQLEGSAQAPTALLFAGQSGSTGCAPAILARELRDIDQDQEPELLLVLRYCSMASCVSGYRAFEYTLVYDLAPGPRLALMLERRIRGQAHEHDTRSRTLVFRDVNNDGHPDAIARGRDCLTNVDRWMRYVNGNGDAPLEDVSLTDCETPELRCADNAFALRDCSERSETLLYDPSSDAWRLATDGADPLPDRDCSGQPLSTAESEP